jgi:hypothetical protein
LIQSLIFVLGLLTALYLTSGLFDSYGHIFLIAGEWLGFFVGLPIMLFATYKVLRS